MTKYNELEVVSNKSVKRVGRGISAGQGKTAGRGTKGQKARTGKKLRATFAGGSGAMMRRTPKGKGFKSLKTPVQVVYMDHLNAFDGKTVDNFTLAEAGMIADPFSAVKIISRGEITVPVTVQVSGASKSVQAAITKAGGSFVKTTVPLKVSVKNSDK